MGEPLIDKVKVENPFKDKGGRPTLSEARLLQSFRTMIYLYSEGKTTKDVCQIMGISRSTLMRLRTRYPNLWDSVSKTRQMVDGVVEQSLFRRAVGYSYTTKKEEWAEDQEGNFLEDRIGRKIKKITKETHHIPPSVDAIKFWLRNRQPDKWHERIEFDYANVSNGELFSQAKNIIKDLMLNGELDDDTKKLLADIPTIAQDFSPEKFKEDVIDTESTKLVNNKEVGIRGYKEPESTHDEE